MPSHSSSRSKYSNSPQESEYERYSVRQRRSRQASPRDDSDYESHSVRRKRSRKVSHPHQYSVGSSILGAVAGCFLGYKMSGGSTLSSVAAAMLGAIGTQKGSRK